MPGIRKILTLVFSLVCVPALAGNTTDPFLEVVEKYQATNPKPELTEDARKFRVQAEFAVQEKHSDKAVELYGKALQIAPWWPEGHFKLAEILGEQKKYSDALREMKRYLLLTPASADARIAQDKIYQWESVVEPVAGKSFKDCPECPEMVEIPAGSFEMGSNNGEANEKPVHHVTIAKTFALGKTEVTQQQWFALMRSEPSYFTGCGDTCPVEQVNWDDAQAFIKKLNAKTGKNYRLPGEAEWEYACRAGGQQEYCGSDTADSVAWNNLNSGGFMFNTPHPVASKQANAFGLFDMSGNVWEWVEDNYHDNYRGAPIDGSAWVDGSSNHLLRGGSWGSDAKYGKASYRSRLGSSYRHYGYGFRVARTLP